MISLVVLIQISVPRLSTIRVIFIILYGGASASLCLYGIWLVNKKETLTGKCRQRLRLWLSGKTEKGLLFAYSG